MAGGEGADRRHVQIMRTLLVNADVACRRGHKAVSWEQLITFICEGPGRKVRPPIQPEEYAELRDLPLRQVIERYFADE